MVGAYDPRNLNSTTIKFYQGIVAFDEYDLTNPLYSKLYAKII